jgi:hypothetical protein
MNVLCGVQFTPLPRVLWLIMRLFPPHYSPATTCCYSKHIMAQPVSAMQQEDQEQCEVGMHQTNLIAKHGNQPLSKKKKTMS